MQGQAVITETLLRAQEQQQHIGEHGDQLNGREGGAELPDGEGSNRPSTASSNDLEPFEVIDEAQEGE